MDKILLLPLNKKKVPKSTLEILRAEQLYSFAEKVNLVFYRAKETENFTKNLDETDTDELICFYDVCSQILSFNQTEIAFLRNNKNKYKELASKYAKFISKEQKGIDDASKLLILQDFDLNLSNIISGQFDDMNYIIKNINKGKLDTNWYSLYEFYRMLHYDNLAKILVEKMAGLGDVYAQILEHNSALSFDDLFDMMIEDDGKGKDK